jgi:small subunit ribosomal protein S4e
MILMDRQPNCKVDGKIRRDGKFPLGIMDVLTLEKTKESYRILYDVKGRFVLKSLKEEEAKFKLCKIKRKELGPNKIPYIVTHDGRTIRYANPEIQVNDTIKLNLEDYKIVDHAKLELSYLAYITAGNNVGRVGTITARDRHYGGFDIVHLKDANGKSFATRIGNVFVIGKNKKPWISLPKEKGLYLSALEKKAQNEGPV